MMGADEQWVQPATDHLVAALKSVDASNYGPDEIPNLIRHIKALILRLDAAEKERDELLKKLAGTVRGQEVW